MHDELKLELCQGARLLYQLGLSVSIAGHLSIMIDEDKMLVNRFGPSFGALKPQDILMLDLDGNILEGNGYVNETIRLHGLIHKHNPQAVALVHTHSDAIINFSTLRSVPKIYDQESCLLANDIGVVQEDYQGLVGVDERVLPIAQAIGKYAAVILPNHGGVTQGANIRLAVIRMIILDMACRRNLQVAAAGYAMGIEPHPIDLEIALSTKKEIDNLAALQLVWNDFISKI